jgi:asparagine synthase (glutamine-hydrolysing)
MVGAVGPVDALAASLAEAPDDAARTKLLNAADFLFALIVETSDRVIAASDLVRSTPIYVARTATGWVVGNDARALAPQLASRALDRASLLEIEMAGYATGCATAYADLRVLECGAFAVFDDQHAGFTPNRYFRYLPGARTDGATTERLRATLDEAFSDLVRRAGGRKVLVPISGGLDSRLVLAKLVEHGCPSLSGFSYGTAGNSDATIGREVAAKLGVPWQFVASRGHRTFFGGEEGRKFWSFCDGLACAPSPQDIVPLSGLRPGPDTIVVNGQTGDFLSGGHIPQALRHGCSRLSFFSAITAKHYGLWRSLATVQHLGTIERRIERVTGPLPEWLSASEAVARHELWEYEARQASWVVNAQRTYEYLGLGWELPLWDPRLVRLFRDASVEQKAGQKLYRQYLEQWNFRGLFAGYSRPRNSWPVRSRPLAVVEKAAQMLGGAALQRRANATLRYFGHYRHQYSELGFGEFMAVRHDMRHILGHHARLWLGWNRFPAAGEGA